MWGTMKGNRLASSVFLPMHLRSAKHDAPPLPRIVSITIHHLMTLMRRAGTWYATEVFGTSFPGENALSPSVVHRRRDFGSHS